MKRFTSAVAFAVGLVSVGTFAHGAQISLVPANVIGTSGSYPDPRFPASNILDTQTGDVHEIGQSASPTSSGFWLNPDNGPANAYITIDLGAEYQLSEIDLFNTHNGDYNDRGTGDFLIVGSKQATDTGGGNFEITPGTAVTLVSGTLTAANNGTDPIPAQAFSVTNTGFYRYIAFEPKSVAVSGTECCNGSTTSYGLNELRAFGTTPEPASFALTAIIGVGLLSRRRRT